MKLSVRGNKIEVTDSIKEYLNEKISRMDKYFDDPSKVEAIALISVRGREQKVEITIPLKKFQIRVEESHSDLYAAIDLAIDKLERQFRKYKTKLISKKRKEVLEEQYPEYIDNQIEDIVRRKKVFLKPIDEEEAITQMELLDHNFYLYKNIETNSICLIYKRNDNKYGIIEAE